MYVLVLRTVEAQGKTLRVLGLTRSSHKAKRYTLTVTGLQQYHLRYGTSKETPHRLADL